MSNHVSLLFASKFSIVGKIITAIVPLLSIVNRHPNAQSELGVRVQSGICGSIAHVLGGGAMAFLYGICSDERLIGK